jgi:hypothetical protein
MTIGGHHLSGHSYMRYWYSFTVEKLTGGDNALPIHYLKLFIAFSISNAHEKKS